jgi:hypothetical protein
LRLTSLVVITLLVLGCTSAFAQKTGSFGFLSYDQKTQYCDYEVLTLTPPFAAGVHNLAGCASGSSGNGVMVGVETTTLTPASGSGQTYAFADNSVEVGYNGGFACGCAVLYVTKLQASTPSQMKAGSIGWAIYYSFEPGSEFLASYGFLTKQLGGSDPNSATFNSVR